METELQAAIRRLGENDDFKVVVKELKNRREDIVQRAEMDVIVRDHPMLINCIAYSKCLGELIHLFEPA